MTDMYVRVNLLVPNVRVIDKPTAQLKIFQPQHRDYTSEGRKPTIRTLSHAGHTVNLKIIGIYWFAEGRLSQEQTGEKSENVLYYYTRYTLKIWGKTRKTHKLLLINEDIYCENKKRKRNSFPLLGSALILWWCIQHGDVIAKSHLVLPDPIKSEYDGSNTDVWLYGPERTTRWMSQKSQKTQFYSELGILWPRSGNGSENLQFHSCQWNSTHISFWFKWQAIEWVAA